MLKVDKTKFDIDNNLIIIPFIRILIVLNSYELSRKMSLTQSVCAVSEKKQ